MPRRNFELLPPYREITSADGIKPFENELFPGGNVLADLVTMNIGNRHVFVYEQNDEILAFLMFDDNDSYFHIEFVATNHVFHSGLRPSTQLIYLLEYLGKDLNYVRIELWSLDQQIQYYQNLGFHETGDVEIGNYGSMSKMIKSLIS